MCGCNHNTLPFRIGRCTPRIINTGAIAPLIQLPKATDARSPYPLAWEEQGLLFPQLPAHLQPMALFKVNTGCREQEVCTLCWDWEVKVPELGTSVFIIPSELVKNGEDRLVVLNRVASSVVEGQREQHPEYVFTYKGRKVTRMQTQHGSEPGEKRQVVTKRCLVNRPRMASKTSGYMTSSTLLVDAGVSFEDRQDLLGHRSSRITTHYSAAELQNLIEATNRVCGENSRKSPELVVLSRA